MELVFSLIVGVAMGSAALQGGALLVYPVLVVVLWVHTLPAESPPATAPFRPITP